MPSANGLFANGGWLQSPRDIEFASKGAFRFRELKTELRDIFSCFLQPDYLGSFADDVIESRTLVDTGVTPGVYNNVTVNSKGQVISAQLKDPLGDPIHSPGGTGFIDCGDIPVPNVAIKGMTRVHIDEFGRVIEADCVTRTGSATGDTLTTDVHGRVTVSVNNNLAARMTALETAVATIQDTVGVVHASNQSGSGSGLTDISLGTSSKALKTGKTYVAVVSVEYERTQGDAAGPGSWSGSYHLEVAGNNVGSFSIGVSKTGATGHGWRWTTGGCYCIPFTVGSDGTKSFEVVYDSGSELLRGASIVVIG